MRFDKVAWHLRLTKTRSAAAALAERGVVRISGRRIEKAHCPVAVGDVLTLPHGSRIRVVRVLALPARRLGAAALAGALEDLEIEAPAPPSRSD